MLPTNPLVRAMLTDAYQITMAYGYWKNGMQDDPAVFEYFFRKNPFGGEFAVFGGLEQAIRYLSSYKFTKRDIRYLREGLVLTAEERQTHFNELLQANVIQRAGNGYRIFRVNLMTGEDYWDEVFWPTEDQVVPGLLEGCDPEFDNWLLNVDCSKVKLYAMPEGTLAFPNEPPMRLVGPLGITQLIESALLNLNNYPSLDMTNAARYSLASPNTRKLEMGLRRAQGPDGAISGSLYAYMGGYNATSNVLAGQLSSIPIQGTHAHSFVEAFTGLDDLKTTMLCNTAGVEHNLVERVLFYRQELGYERTNQGELAAFIAYAQAFPKKFLALVDTYNTLLSGVPNFICVALALYEFGYKSVGIRIDSGDLAYLSKESRTMINEVGSRYAIPHFLGSEQNIVASNDINEPILRSLEQQGHEINTFGIGTNAVTCSPQAAFGGVYKLMMVRHKLRMKISGDRGKMTWPGEKETYRLYGQDGYPIIDLNIPVGDSSPQVGQRILCCHPYQEEQRVYVTPAKVVLLHHCYWEGRPCYGMPNPQEVKQYVQYQMAHFRPDHLRSTNPTPYKVAVSERLYAITRELWADEVSIQELA